MSGIKEEAWNERLRRLRLAHGLTQQEVADAVGASKNAVSNWEADRARPDFSRIPALCRLLQVTPAAFFGLPEDDARSESDRRLLERYHLLDSRGRRLTDRLMTELLDIQQEEAETGVHTADLKLVPVAPDPAAAGTGSLLNENASGSVWLHLPPALRRRAGLVVTVSGDSMEPTFQNGDRLLVEPGTRPDEGGIGIFIADGLGYVKEYRADGLHSRNPAYSTLRFGPETEVRCAGTVLGPVTEEMTASPQEAELMEQRRAHRPRRTDRR